MQRVSTDMMNNDMQFWLRRTESSLAAQEGRVAERPLARRREEVPGLRVDHEDDRDRRRRQDSDMERWQSPVECA